VWVLLARAGLPIPVPSAGAVGAAAGLQAADSFVKLSAYVQPSLVYCQREADRLYAAWREQQDLSAQSQGSVTAELDDHDNAAASPEASMLDQLLAQIAAGQDEYAGQDWQRVQGGAQLVVYDRSVTLEYWREQMWDFIAMEGGKAEIRGRPEGYQGHDYRVRVRGVNPDDSLCIERNDGSIEHCAPASEIVVALQPQPQPVWASVLRSAAIAIERLLPQGTHAPALQRVVLLVADSNQQDSDTLPQMRDWVAKRSQSTGGFDVLLPLDKLGDKQAAAVVGVRASHQIGGAGHRTIPALCVAVPDLLPGDALVMDQSLHWQLTSTGVPNNDDTDPPKMLLFEFTAAENSIDRQHGALDTLVEAVVPWCMLNGGVPWQ